MAIKHLVSLDTEKFQSKPNGAAVGAIVKRLAGEDTNIEVTAEDLAISLVQPNGQSWSPAIFSGGKKTKECWESQGFVALDFDYEDPKDEDEVKAKKAEQVLTAKKEIFGNNYSFNPDFRFNDVLERCQKYGVMPCVIHNSFTSRKDNNKFRVIFQLFETTSNTKIIDSVLYLLFILFPESDIACATDRSRFFYGGKDVLWKENDNVLDPGSLYKAAAGHINENFPENLDVIRNKILFHSNLHALKSITSDEYNKLTDEEKLDVYIHGSDGYKFTHYQFLFRSLTTEDHVKPVVENTMGEYDQRWLEQALKFVTPDDYDTWYKVAMGLKQSFGDSAKELWLRWSKTAIKPDSDYELEKKWNESIKPNGSLTVGTVRHLAIKGGWDPVPETVKKFNKNFFHMVDDSGNEVVLQEELNEETNYFNKVIKNTRLKPIKRNSFININEGIGTLKYKSSKNGKEVEIEENRAKYWLRHEKRRIIDRIVFKPKSAIRSGEYNLWTGFAVEEVPKVDPSRYALYMKHIFDIIANGDKQVFNYIIGWMAYCIQNPHKLPGVAIILVGGQGTGKSLFVELFAQIFGKHYICIQDRESLTGRFNDHLANKVLVFADEAMWSRDYEALNKLKNYITNKSMNIDGKFKAISTFENFMHIIMASNNRQVLNIDNDDRRFFITEVSEKMGRGTNRTHDQKVMVKKYFDDMVKQFVDDDGVSHFFTFLNHLDLTDFNINMFPETDAIYDHKLESLSHKLEGFLYEKLACGKLYDLDDKWGVVDKETFYNDYCDYIKRHNPRYSKPANRTWFGRELNDIFGECLINNSTGFVNKIDPTTKTKIVVKEKVFKFSPLNFCRAKFADYINVPNYKMAWEKVEEGENRTCAFLLPGDLDQSQEYEQDKKEDNMDTKSEWASEEVRESFEDIVKTKFDTVITFPEVVLEDGTVIPKQTISW